MAKTKKTTKKTTAKKIVVGKNTQIDETGRIPGPTREVAAKQSRCDFCGRITNVVINGVYCCSQECEDIMMRKR